MVNLSAAFSRDPNIHTNNAHFSTHGISAPDKEGLTCQFFWKNLSLSPNDVVEIEVLETEKIDPPFKRFRSDEEAQYTEEERREMKNQGQLMRDEES